MDRHLARPIPMLIGVALLLVAVVTPAAGGDIAADTDFAVARRNHGAVRQIAELRAAGDRVAADLIAAMIRTPHAEWFTQGTPKAVKQDVRNEVRRAAAKGRLPVLVAYNIPFRDCAQFSAGGATTVAEYAAWIDAFAAGIGDLPAVVILEPDGLGIIPYYDPYAGADGSSALEWCQPPEADPATAAADRFAMLNYAVDALKARPNVRVYLDGTHSAWLGVGDIAHRLVQAGVARADGFYLNASNYQFTENSVQYGTWISQCLATGSTPEDFVNCPNQYWNGGPLPAKIAVLLGEWTGVALSRYGIWSEESDDPALNTSGINLRYAGVTGSTNFVVDTSRKASGPWQPTSGYPDPQDWCNPPGRGLGVRPTADTGLALVDAYLWIKTPGESDGECTRGLGPDGTTVDPEWGRIDPAAGAWFPQQALELAQLASPPLSGD